MDLHRNSRTELHARAHLEIKKVDPLHGYQYSLVASQSASNLFSAYLTLEERRKAFCNSSHFYMHYRSSPEADFCGQHSNPSAGMARTDACLNRMARDAESSLLIIRPKSSSRNPHRNHASPVSTARCGWRITLFQFRQTVFCISSKQLKS